MDRFREAIDEAYGDAVKDVWRVFFDALSIAGNDGERTKAYERFVRALAVAQQAHEIALQAIV